MVLDLLANARELDWTLDPLDALARWPRRRPVALLHSGRPHPRWSRFSLLTAPGSAYRFQQGRSAWVGDPTCDITFTHRPFDDLRQLLADPDALWLGCLAYDLGRYVERLPRHARHDRDWPIIQLHHCPGWLVYDHLAKRWRAGGAWRDAPPVLEAAPRTDGFHAGAPEPLVTRERFESTIARAIEYIHAGDVFEVNLAQRFTASFLGDPRALYARLAEASPAWFGAYLELAAGPGEPRRTIASTSPELFLDTASDGRVITRPIKGTRPATVDADELRRSEKDQAELNMVVDLLRNDLGRVCAYGSVRVDEPRTIESHPTVHHGVATVRGELHHSQDIVDLLRATMPGGSITGAPKVRAMQVIDELEPVRRGPYCGALGWLRGGTAQLNIAIRTLLIEQDAQGAGRVDFSVGGGIVADSDPASEYHETLDKAAALVAALGNPLPAASEAI